MLDEKLLQQAPSMAERWPLQSTLPCEQVKRLTFGENWCLPCELLQHLGSTGQSVSALTDADVQAELANAELSHGVLLFLTLVLQW